MHVFYRGKFDIILFHPKNLLGNAKMPKYGNMGHFHLFFFGGGLETSLENIENKLKFREDVALRVYFLQKKN